GVDALRLVPAAAPLCRGRIGGARRRGQHLRHGAGAVRVLVGEPLAHDASAHDRGAVTGAVDGQTHPLVRRGIFHVLYRPAAGPGPPRAQRSGARTGLSGVGGFVRAQEAQKEFVPADSIPRQELPSGPLLYGAYAFVWAVLI